MLWNQIHVLQSFLLRKTVPLIPFILFEQHHVLHFNLCPPVKVIFEGHAYSVALMNHYFCTCFVNLIKKELALLRSVSLCVQFCSCTFMTCSMQADIWDGLSAHGRFLMACRCRIWLYTTRGCCWALRWSKHTTHQILYFYIEPQTGLHHLSVSL